MAGLASYPHHGKRKSAAPSPGGTTHDVIPDLEVVDVPHETSFKVWSHGYPFRTVRWHFHPEYEIHLITATTGRSFIGDFIGTFEPGNLVMTGPNLPHNWISDVAPGTVVPQRCLVLQFSREFITGCMAAIPEMRPIDVMLRESALGIEFAPEVGAAAKPIMERLLEAGGIERVGLFVRLLYLLDNGGRRRLASCGYQSTPEIYASEPLNHILNHISRNLGSDLRQDELAQLSGFSSSGFSRAFEQHTGLTFVRYVNQMRINRACELLVRTKMNIAAICFQVGFNNLSNFNRQFLKLKGVSPSRFRTLEPTNMGMPGKLHGRRRMPAVMAT
jgi:AraC-like DNA-binding protein